MTFKKRLKKSLKFLKKIHNGIVLSNQAEEVAAIAEETAAGTQQVKIAISHQTEMMNSVRNLTVDLKSQAEKLKSTITKFKL